MVGILAAVVLVGSSLGWFGSAAAVKVIPSLAGVPQKSSGGGVADGGVGQPDRWKVADRPAKPPGRKPLSREEIAKFAAEDEKFRAEAWQPFWDATHREAESNPKLRAILDLRESLSGDSKAYGDFRHSLRDWEMAAEGIQEKSARNGMFFVVDHTADLLWKISWWQDERFRSFVDPDDIQVRRDLAKDLVDHDIDPRGLLGDPAEARAAIEVIERQLLEKFHNAVAASEAPQDLFNETNLRLMANSNHYGLLYTEILKQVSPETRALEESAKQRIADYRKEAEKLMRGGSP